MCRTIFERGLAGAVIQFGMHPVRKDSGISSTVTVYTAADAAVGGATSSLASDAAGVTSKKLFVTEIASMIFSLYTTTAGK